MTSEKTQLISVIRHFVPVSAQDERIIDTLFEADRLEPGDFFLQAGDVCRYVGFVTTGLLRYYVLDNGDEHTYDFSPEQTFASNYESFLPQIPSTRFIQAIETTILLRISHANLQRLYEQMEHGQQFGRLVAEQLFVTMLQKLTSFYQENADERYDQFVQLYPQLIDRLPQYVVASYVGIKPQSLSQIRAHRAGKRY